MGNTALKKAITSSNSLRVEYFDCGHRSGSHIKECCGRYPSRTPHLIFTLLLVPLGGMGNYLLTGFLVYPFFRYHAVGSVLAIKAVRVGPTASDRYRTFSDRCASEFLCNRDMFKNMVKHIIVCSQDKSPSSQNFYIQYMI